MNIVLNKYYEVFDTSNNNELKATYSILESAIDMAKDNENYAVDLILELENGDGESILSSGDNLFTMQVYPISKDYNNHDVNIKIVEVE